MALVRLAEEHRVPLIPWGGGSGVCGGTLALSGGIIVDVKRMQRVLSVSREDHLVTAQAGINGQHLEDALNLQGLTLGHFPSSIYCSTLGGWLATRSAGQMSTRYGKIEDMLESLEAVAGGGERIRCGVGDTPDLAPLFVGSEGTLGVITEATMRVRPLPSHRVFRAYEFPRVAAGCEGIRRILQRGLRPAVVRLYDQMDSLLARPSGDPDDAPSAAGALASLIPERVKDATAELPRLLLGQALAHAGMLSKLAEALVPKLGRGCLLIVGLEGEPALAEAEASLCHAELLAAGGKDLGDGPGLRWYAHRYSVSYKMSPLFAAGGFVDTLEVATTWDKLLHLYGQVREALSPLAIVLAHFSHAYPEGCSIYFTFAAAAEGRARSEALYDELWRRGLAAVTRSGGTISHHHGVGVSKASFMEQEHGTSFPLYRQLKALYDPCGVFNPGKMGL